MSTFNIGSQTAGSIQNVGGNMVVQDGIHGTASVHVTELRGQLAHLSEEIDRLALSADRRALVKGALAEAEAEAAAPAPRSHRIAQSLRRVTETLDDAGGLATAAVGVVRALASAVFARTRAPLARVSGTTFLCVCVNDSFLHPTGSCLPG